MKFTKLTPNLVVRDVQAAVHFYQSVLGFQPAITVPDTPPYVFASVTSGNVEIFFNDQKAVAEDYPPLAKHPLGGTMTLFLECEGIEEILRAVEKSAMSGGKTSRAAIHKTSFKKALAAGVKIAFGTDAGSFLHGTQAIEFEWMTRYGMSPLEAIRSATINAADLLGWSDDIGVLEPGKYADIIAVDASPLADIKQLEHVKFVMKGGEVVRNDYSH